MGIAELLILASGLSMDAFAVSVCKGLAIQRPEPRHALAVGDWFGVFQALMPAIGWLLGSAFADLIVAVDHWIAFVLLALIGGSMAERILDVFLTTEFEGGRHQRRVDKIMATEH